MTYAALPDGASVACCSAAWPTHDVTWSSTRCRDWAPTALRTAAGRPSVTLRGWEHVVGDVGVLGVTRWEVRLPDGTRAQLVWRLLHQALPA